LTNDKQYYMAKYHIYLLMCNYCNM